MRATNFSSLSAVSVLLLTIVCTTVPVWARVDISCAQVGETNEVVISYDATSETNLVRAFAFDIQLDNDANIVSVVGLSLDYWVYPGSIQIAADDMISYIGTMSAEESDLPSDTQPGPPDGNGVTLEAASLYAPVGPGSPNAPAKSGDLASIIVSRDTCLSISANVSRAGPTGVVMEDPNEEVEVHFPSIYCVDVNCCPPLECMKDTCPEYSDWVAWGKPWCWCCAKHCRCDVNCQSFFGKPVTLTDLTIFKAAFNLPDLELAQVTDGICADFNHKSFFGKRVTLSDLNTCKLWFNKPEASVPECDKTCYNFWETP